MPLQCRNATFLHSFTSKIILNVFLLIFALKGNSLIIQPPPNFSKRRCSGKVTLKRDLRRNGNSVTPLHGVSLERGDFRLSNGICLGSVRALEQKLFRVEI